MPFLTDRRISDESRDQHLVDDLNFSQCPDIESYYYLCFNLLCF